MAFEKLREAFENAEPVTTVDVFRTLASLSNAGVAPGYFFALDDLGETFASTGRQAFSYPEFVVLKRGLSRRITSLGWIWFAGTVTIDSEIQRVCFPAVTVRLGRPPGTTTSIGNLEEPVLAGVVSGNAKRELARRLTTELGWNTTRHLRFGRLTSPSKWVKDEKALRAWIDDFARASGFEVSEIRYDSPASHIDKDTISAHIGTVLVDGGYGIKKSAFDNAGFDLNALDGLSSVGGTAFNTLYGAKSDREPDEPDRSGQPLMAFRPLSERQRTIAERIAGAPLAALSGAPGTGKTHIISAIAADAVARGESVLVVAGSAHAVDALLEHFFDTPGPPPVAFGGAQYATKLSKELARVAERIARSAGVTSEESASAAAHDEKRQAIRNAIASLYEDNVVDPTASAYEKVLGDSLDIALDDLVAGEGEAARVAGELLTDHWIETLDKPRKKVLSKIGEIAELSLVERRREFGWFIPKVLTAALPLWVGSIDDVDDVLPPYLAMFDLVIFDEASQIDQVRAANVLVRARRALVCGDPAQIGIDRAPTDAQLAEAMKKHRTSKVKFDVQNQSLFDAVAAKVPVEVLDEHFRSAPHLIEFSSRRFYDGGLFTATRNPANEAADHIDLVIVDGERAPDGVNRVEVEACLRVLERYVEVGDRSIGLVTPFPAQAASLNAAVQERYSPKDIAKFGILVGDINQFQGRERDQMIISLGVGSGEEDSAWTVVNDPRFFNVMVTRSRFHSTLITSSSAPPGLAGEYVRWTEPLVDLVRDEDVADPWTRQVADAFRSSGIPVRTGYRAGRHIVDLVIGGRKSAVAVDCIPHTDGPSAHIDRALTLRRTGWVTADAFRSAWDGRLDELVAELSALTQSSPLRY